jgi:hypothetical protein
MMISWRRFAAAIIISISMNKSFLPGGMSDGGVGSENIEASSQSRDDDFWRQLGIDVFDCCFCFKVDDFTFDAAGRWIALAQFSHKSVHNSCFPT